MRVILSAVLLVLAGCDVDNDPANEKVTVQYDREQIEKSAAAAGKTVKDVASGIANVAEDTGRAIKKEVGDVDVDLKVTRQQDEETVPADQTKQ